MNVLLVPAHPGFPGQIPQSRKTVVVVVVVCFATTTTDMAVFACTAHQSVLDAGLPLGPLNPLKCFFRAADFND